MKLFNFFNFQETDTKSELQKRIETMLPTFGEEKTLILTCISGLLARVASADFKIVSSEKNEIIKILKTWKNLEENEAQVITDIALEHAEEFSGIEDHHFSNPLVKSIETNERFELLKKLFLVAMSDNILQPEEESEIRKICHALKLPNNYFTAAKVEITK